MINAKKLSKIIIFSNFIILIKNIINQFDQHKIPNISIFLPIYNKALFLNRSIKSIQKQTLKNIEIVAVNDFSTDDSLKILKKLYKKDKKIKIINNDRNHGLLYSRAMGILNCTGEYLLNLDPDDKFYNLRNLEYLYNIVKKNKTDLIIFRIKKYYQKSINKSLTIKSKKIRKLYSNFIKEKWKIHHLITNKLIKKSIYLKAYKYFENKILKDKWNYGEDNIWSRLINDYSKSKIYLNKYIYLYYKNQMSLMHNAGNLLEKKNRIYRYEMIENIYNLKSLRMLKKLLDFTKDIIKYDNEIRKKMIRLFLYIEDYFKNKKIISEYIKLTLNKLSNNKIIIINNFYNKNNFDYNSLYSFIFKIKKIFKNKIILSIDINNKTYISDFTNYVFDNDIFLCLDNNINNNKLKDFIILFPNNTFIIFSNKTNNQYLKNINYSNIIIENLNII